MSSAPISNTPISSALVPTISYAPISSSPEPTISNPLVSTVNALISSAPEPNAPKDEFDMHFSKEDLDLFKLVS